MATKKTSKKVELTDIERRAFDAWSRQWRALCASAPPLGFNVTRAPSKTTAVAGFLAVEWCDQHLFAGQHQGWLLAAFYADQIAREIGSASAVDTSHPFHALATFARAVVDGVSTLHVMSAEDAPDIERAKWRDPASKVRAQVHALLVKLSKVETDNLDKKPTKAEKVSALWRSLKSMCVAGVREDQAAESIARELGGEVIPFDVTRYIRGASARFPEVRNKIDNHATKLARKGLCERSDEVFTKSQMHRWRKAGARGVRPGKCAVKGCKYQVWDEGETRCMSCISRGDGVSRTPAPATP